jgi:protoheme IX farnesyltransferase
MSVVKRLRVSLQTAVYLAKAPLCLLVGYSALFGFFLADPTVSSRALLTGLGLFFLATGAATLNSIQEHHIDAHMERTKNRPLPRKAVSLLRAGFQALLLLGAGVIVLNVVSETIFPIFMAVFAVVLYNGIYTPLKQQTVLAIVPGAVCGALPPYIGWLVAGGGKTGFEPFLLITLMILWQVPHFWLVLLHHREDYKSGIIPSLYSFFQEETIRRFFITWIGGLVSVMILFAILPCISGSLARILIILNAFSLLGCFFLRFRSKRRNNYMQLFVVLNGALFLHMTIIAVGSIYLS